MSQVRRTQYFARSAKWVRSEKQREEKNEAPVTSPLFWLFRPPTPTSSSTAIAGKWFPYDSYDRCDAIVPNLKLVDSEKRFFNLKSRFTAVKKLKREHVKILWLEGTWLSFFSTFTTLLNYLLKHLLSKFCWYDLKQYKDSSLYTDIFVPNGLKMLD